jgi:hypothetical protein
MPSPLRYNDLFKRLTDVTVTTKITMTTMTTIKNIVRQNLFVQAATFAPHIIQQRAPVGRRDTII